MVTLGCGSSLALDPDSLTILSGSMTRRTLYSTNIWRKQMVTIASQGSPYSPDSLPCKYMFKFAHKDTEKYTASFEKFARAI